jgi:rRNA maturation endonuclease Nob1
MGRNALVTASLGYAQGRCRACRKPFAGPGDRCQACARAARVKAAERKRRRRR